MPSYFEDFVVGDRGSTPGRTITETDVVLFAGLTGDYASIHTDAAFAERSQFGKRVAHGLIGLAYAQGLVWRVTSPEAALLASLGWNNWRFLGPIEIGDTIHVEYHVKDKRQSKSKPSQAIITEELEVVNQRGEVVQSGEHLTLVPVRGGGEG